MNFMKKLVVTLSAFLLAVSALSASDATVVSVTGKVEIQKNGSWVALKEGDTIKKGAVVSTGFKSEGQFKFQDSYFTLGALTRMTIEDLFSSQSKDSAQIFLNTGSLKANIKRTEDRRANFKVRSPVATASVRGTEFGITSLGDISVSEGLVSASQSTSDSPEIAPDTAEENEADNGMANLGAEHAGIFDSTTEVADEYGIPVAKGQSCQFDATTATFSTPGSEIAKSSSNIPNMTESLANQETISDNKSATATTTQTASTASVTSSQNGAVVNITIKF